MFYVFFIVWDFLKSPVFWGIFFPHSATTGVDVRGRNCRLTVKVVSSFSVEPFYLFIYFLFKEVSALWILSEDRFSPLLRNIAPVSQRISGLIQRSCHNRTQWSTSKHCQALYAQPWHGQGPHWLGQNKSNQARQSPSRNKSVHSLVVKVWIGLVSFLPLSSSLILSLAVWKRHGDHYVCPYIHLALAFHNVRSHRSTTTVVFFGPFPASLAVFPFSTHTCFMTYLTSVLKIYVWSSPLNRSPLLLIFVPHCSVWQGGTECIVMESLRSGVQTCQHVSIEWRTSVPPPCTDWQTCMSLNVCIYNQLPLHILNPSFPFPVWRSAWAAGDAALSTAVPCRTHRGQRLPAGHVRSEKFPCTDKGKSTMCQGGKILMTDVVIGKV